MTSVTRQLSIDPGATLLDSEEGWHRDPRKAFEALVLTNEFNRTRSKDARLRPQGQRMQDDSVKVYTFMFGKYLRHLEAVGVTVPDATPTDVAKFFEGALGEVARETYKRYLRLIERVYDDLCKRGFTKVNPVAAWLQKQQGQATKVQLRPPPGPNLISPADVARLQDWLYTRGRNAIAQDDWRSARDIALASLSLGSGMRCFELLVLTETQVKYTPGASARDRFEFDIPSRKTVATARKHDTAAEEMCADLMESWWKLRWSDGFRTKSESKPKRVASGHLVFPSGFKGRPLEKSTLFKALRELAADALEQHVLDDSTRWVLERGAQGLRRAYVLSEIARGESLDLLRHRLGHWHKEPVEDYARELKAAKRAKQLDLLSDS